MLRTVEAVIDEHGNVHLLEAIQLTEARKALVTILEDAPTTGVLETALLSEQALAQDWDQPEEDKEWSYLQSER